jgi:hypothetical protein
MTPGYAQAVEVKRRPWQRRIEVFSPKLRRRLTLFSHDAQDAWILLEADPRVQTFCERPALSFFFHYGTFHLSTWHFFLGCANPASKRLVVEG